MVYHPDDLLYDTREMLDRIRPKQRYDIALVAAAAMLDLGIVWGASMLKPRAPAEYSFMRAGNTIFVLDNSSGDVSACDLEEEGNVVCSESDSAYDAMIRRLDVEDHEF
jgi:hypothetical protein